MNNTRILPPILNGWTLHILAPNVRDCIECPELCTDPLFIESGINEIGKLSSSTVKPRYYVTEPGFNSRWKTLSYCNGYESRRTAITEAIRRKIENTEGIAPVSYLHPKYGALSGYTQSRFNDTELEIVLLVDDLPQAFKESELTVEKFGIDHSEMWYIMTFCSPDMIVWKSTATPMIDPEQGAKAEFDELVKDYME